MDQEETTFMYSENKNHTVWQVSVSFNTDVMRWEKVIMMEFNSKQQNLVFQSCSVLCSIQKANV